MQYNIQYKAINLMQKKRFSTKINKNLSLIKAAKQFVLYFDKILSI